MPDDQTTETESTEQTEETTEVTEEKPEEKPDEKPALSAEQLQTELTKVRAEAANYRVRLREAETKLSEAKTPEDIEAAVAEFKTANAALERQLLVTKVAAKFELPEELAARLQGDDEAALEADAKSLAAFVAPKNPESLSGGLTPGESDEDFDPVKAAHEAKKRRY
jgi:hypothetical protein